MSSHFSLNFFQSFICFQVKKQLFQNKKKIDFFIKSFDGKRCKLENDTTRRHEISRHWPQLVASSLTLASLSDCCSGFCPTPAATSCPPRLRASLSTCPRPHSELSFLCLFPMLRSATGPLVSSRTLQARSDHRPLARAVLPDLAFAALADLRSSLMCSLPPYLHGSSLIFFQFLFK